MHRTSSIRRSPGTPLALLLVTVALLVSLLSFTNLAGDRNNFFVDPASAAECDPNYLPCIPPPPPDLNCDDIGFGVRVIGPEDPHGLDRDGDGVGCESYSKAPPAPTTTSSTTTLHLTTTTTSAAPSVMCGGLRATLVGTAGNDVLRGTNGADVIAGLGGNDVITGRGGNDVICGGKGKDKLKGDAGADVLYGDAGRDNLVGGGGKDVLDGGTGRDVCNGGKAKDRATSCEKKKKI